MSNGKKTYCGFVTIVGRTNVGKSTLLNKLVGQKISITSCKKRTTIRNIIGIHTEGKYQVIYMDTCGLYIEDKYTAKHTIKRINDIPKSSELIIFVVENTHWITGDKIILNKLQNDTSSVILVVNKIDCIKKN